MKKLYKILADLPLVQTENLQLLPLLQEALMGEFQQLDLYLAYKEQLLGLVREPIAEEFEAHADDEIGHISILQRYIVNMGAKPTVSRKPIPDVDGSVKSIVMLQLQFEQEAVSVYQKILSALGDTDPLRIEIETILAKEQEHAHDLQMLLRD